MHLNEIDYGEASRIEGYGPGFFRIAGKVLKAPLMVTLNGAKFWAGFQDVKAILEFCKDIDVIFIGTGREMQHIPLELRKTLEAGGLGVEVMSTPSACRTYNVLLAENRRVAAALIGVEEI